MDIDVSYSTPPTLVYRARQAPISLYDFSVVLDVVLNRSSNHKTSMKIIICLLLPALMD